MPHNTLKGSLCRRKTKARVGGGHVVRACCESAASRHNEKKKRASKKEDAGRRGQTRWERRQKKSSVTGDDHGSLGSFGGSSCGGRPWLRSRTSDTCHAQVAATLLCSTFWTTIREDFVSRGGSLVRHRPESED